MLEMTLKSSQLHNTIYLKKTYAQKFSVVMVRSPNVTAFFFYSFFLSNKQKLVLTETICLIFLMRNLLMNSLQEIMSLAVFQN